MFTLPLTDPVMIFALTMVIFLVSPMIMKMLRIPGIIGPIIAGIIIGPHGLGVLQRGQTIELLGTVGLLFIIFIAGLEMDLEGFKKYRNRSIVFGFLSFIFPLALGTFIGIILGYSMTASILLGSILGSHTLLGYPIASRLGIAKNKAVTTALGGTLLTDTLALLVLAVVTGAATGNLTIQFFIVLVISLIVFTLLNIFGIPYISRQFFRNVINEGSTDFTYVIVILFLSGFLATVAGLQPIIGAFLAGLSLNRLVFDHGTLMNRIRFTANALFIPFFLLSVGMLMDLSVLIENPRAWLLTGLILVSVFLGKLIASWIASYVYQYNKEERHITFGLTIPQAAATLASTLVGYDVGLLDQATVNGVIIMILGTCIAGPYLVEKHGRKLSLLEEQTEFESGDAPQRIMIPLYNPETMDSLLDLGFVLRKSSGTEEPLYPLTVVKKDLKNAENEVAKAEKMLNYAVKYASGAEVPVKTITRVNYNIANGIERAMAEERATKVIVGWNGEKTAPQRIFGTVIDQLLSKTHQSILITRLGHPLNITKRIVVVLPRGIDHSFGFIDALKHVKKMANFLGATLLFLIIGEGSSKYDKYIKETTPNPASTIRVVPDWDTFYLSYFVTLKDDDLVVVLSGRRGTIAWHPELEEVPNKLTNVNPESFIIYYPTEEKHVDMRGASGTIIPNEMLFKRDFD
ncbi:cation:proton antiporter domain-containing protein [Salirhabdus salicampi]|uniref:cation:proton antiporter domain-containing protein n=1 Tax=Salirhabdus salicampi TaxID=476102 RepID=UPI0020C28020|nr:cation:proton antiporter [Salirhabdus salicampi]MCP8616208.1 cation:proton antiporter [Salirhabdus salicampi]